MSVFCSPECEETGEICDFCLTYAFNGVDGVYVGEGVCEHPAHTEPADPCEGCDDFHCRLA